MVKALANAAIRSEVKWTSDTLGSALTPRGCPTVVFGMHQQDSRRCPICTFSKKKLTQHRPAQIHTHDNTRIQEFHTTI